MFGRTQITLAIGFFCRNKTYIVQLDKGHYNYKLKTKLLCPVQHELQSETGVRFHLSRDNVRDD